MNNKQMQDISKMLVLTEDAYNLAKENHAIAYEKHLAWEERERIIKMLENPMHHNIQLPDIHQDCYTCVIIALIKGENK